MCLEANIFFKKFNERGGRGGPDKKGKRSNKNLEN